MHKTSKNNHLLESISAFADDNIALMPRSCLTSTKEGAMSYCRLKDKHTKQRRERRGPGEDFLVSAAERYGAFLFIFVSVLILFAG